MTAKDIDVLLGAGLPFPVADMLVDADLGLSRGELENNSGDLRRLIHRATTPLADAVRASVHQSNGGIE